MSAVELSQSPAGTSSTASAPSYAAYPPPNVPVPCAAPPAPPAPAAPPAPPAPFTHGRVALERDYSRGLVPRFCVALPPQLEGRVSADELARVVAGVNEQLEAAESLSAATVAEGCLAFVTLWTSSLLLESAYSKCLRRMEAFLREQNELFAERGIEFINPCLNGLVQFDVMVQPSADKTCN
eukprot:m51a1_g600 Golgi complex associated protein of 16 kD (182) ;mRNA; f:74025-74731